MREHSGRGTCVCNQPGPWLSLEIYSVCARPPDVSPRIARQITRAQEHELEEQRVTATEGHKDCLCMKDGVVQCLGTVSRGFAKRIDGEYILKRSLHSGCIWSIYWALTFENPCQARRPRRS